MSSCNEVSLLYYYYLFKKFIVKKNQLHLFIASNNDKNKMFYTFKI